jgi:DNA replication protein DnaC
MGFNREDIALVKEEIRRKNIKAKDEATEHLRELESKIPGFREVERGFSDIGAMVVASAVDRTMSAEQRAAFLSELDKKRDELTVERARLLTAHGYPIDYTVPKYSCPLCNDTGYNGVNMCACMRKELIRRGYESAGIGGLIDTQSFESFSLEYYAVGEQRNYMESVLRFCREYAESFDPAVSGHILFIGGTGLGKTHLSTSIARVVIEKGNNVVYESAQNIFSDFETEHYSNKYVKGELSGKYMDCDLLIIDDLGTEMASQFNQACLYNIINTRLNRRLPMIVSSNITDPAEIRKRYTDRLSSRFFGEFSVFNPKGVDIRSQKLARGR